jgi:hypothetical protein
MKHLSPQDPGYERELPVPFAFSVRKRHYVIALLIVLVFSIALLCVVLLIGVGAYRTNNPADTPDSDLPPSSSESKIDTEPGENTPPPSTQVPSTSDTPESAPSDTPPDSGPSPEQLLQSQPGSEGAQSPTEEPESTPQPPVIVVEQVVLSGSAELVYRSYGDGSCILTGIGACTDRCLIIPPRSPSGDTVIAIDAEAFLGCELIEAVQIPATVKSIGARAFADCSSLVQFCVAADNAAFCAADGVLYSRDMTSLLCYPSGRPCPTASIPASVTYISAKAFSPNAAYTSIRFEGSLAQWRGIRIEDGNAVLYTLPKSFAE